jgi:RNA polymerase sigma-B factor
MAAVVTSEQVSGERREFSHRLRERSTHALFRRFRRTGDPRAGEALVRRFLPLARKLARRYHGGGEPLEDLVQVASVGLVKAIQRYDDRRGVSFSSYAVPTITGELKRYFRDNSWATHVPRGMRERALEVNKAIRQAVEKTGRTPRPRELAEQLELEEREVLEAMRAYAGFDASSLDEPVFRSDEHEEQPRLETIGTAEDSYELADDRMTINSVLRRLPVQDRRVLHMRFVEDRTQSEIASRIGVSQMQVSRILRRTLGRLRITLDRTISGPSGERLQQRASGVMKRR